MPESGRFTRIAIVKLTIVTVNRNNAAGLARTLESTFAAQSGFDDWEQVVVDGASTDGSFATLDKWKDNPHLGWHVSEPDAGIYNAMNKGASHARGDYLLFLNSGDELLPGVLEKVFAAETAADLLYGDLLLHQGDRDIPWRVDEPDDVARPAYFLFRTPPHQSTFIARRLHERFGGYDETLQICADRKFFFRCILEASPRLARLPFAISRFEWGGTSNDPSLDTRKRTEWEEMLVPVFGRLIAHRAAFPPDGRPWIRTDVAEAANKDRKLANVLRRATAGIARLWRFAPTRFLLRAVGSTASFAKRLVCRG